MIVWICGQWKENKPWEFQGVYDSEDKAIKACCDQNYFIAPAEMNKQRQHETGTWKGCYYPIGKNNE